MTFSGFGSAVLGVFLLDFLVEFVVLGVFMVGLKVKVRGERRSIDDDE